MVNLEHCFVRNTVRHSVCGKTDAVVIAGYQLLTAQKPLSIRIRRCDRIDRLAGHSVSQKARQRRSRLSTVGDKMVVNEPEYAGVLQHSIGGFVGPTDSSRSR